MAYCSNCGTQISDQAVFCPNCGHTTEAKPRIVAGGRRTEGTAIASLVLGIVGLVACPFVAGILAVVFGNQARSKIAADPTLDGEGMAKAGVVMGWIGIGISVLIFIFWIAVAASVHR
jgi:DNA-directed RNA polymerase subunit RPC12/RpoP